MTQRFNVNVQPLDGADAMFKWKEWMKTATGSGGPGWTVVASSDGYGAGNSTNNTSFTRPSYLNQDFISNTDTLKGYKSWFVLRMPGGNSTDGYKEICVQSLAQTYGGNPASITSWGQFRVKFSPSGFNLSTGTQFQVPSAKSVADRGLSSVVYHTKKDEIVWGTGTDSAPGTGVDLFGPTGFKMHMMASDSDGYGLYFFTTRTGTNKIGSIVMLDPMLTGSYPSEDKQPYVWFGRAYSASLYTTVLKLSSNDMNSASIQNSTGLYYQGAFFNYGGQYETFAGVGAATPTLRNYWNGYLEPLANRVPSNPHTGKDDLFPLMWIKPDPDLWGNNLQGNGTYSADGWPNLAFGYKGISSLLKIVSTNRSTLDTLSVSAAGDRIVVNDMCLPWQSGTTPQL